MAACFNMLQSSWRTAVAQSRPASVATATTLYLLPHRTWQRSNSVSVIAKKGSNKTKAPNKADLPTKVCVSCGRPFTWRKKWELVWDDVK